MSKLVKLQIKDPKNLEFILPEGANPGDYISLKEINQIDLSYIQNFVNDKNNEIIQKKLDELLQKEKQNIINEYKQSEEFRALEVSNSQLREDIKVQIEKTNSAINTYKQSNEYQDLVNQKNQLENELQLKNKEFENLKWKSIDEFKQSNEYLSLKDTIDQLNIKNAKTEIEAQKNLEILKKEFELNHEKEIGQFNKEISNMQKKIDDLERNRNINSKLIGENLEKWIQDKYNDALGNIEDCKIEKLNYEIDGTKADFLYTVFVKENPKDIIGSVTIEAKSQKDLSQTRIKNSAHFKKLDKDRQNNNSDFALLVTELEPEEEFVIKKIHEYDNMYMCRPYVMIAFLSMVRLIYKKREEILQSSGQINFYEKEKIIKDFDEMKNDIIGIQVKNINQHLEKIQDNANKIQTCANNILQSTNVVLTTHIEQLKQKINQFKIQKIIKEINQFN